MFTRRQFLKIGAATAAGVALTKLPHLESVAYAFSQSANLRKFIEPMRRPGAGIPLAASDGTRTWGSVTATHYTIDIADFTDQLHPNLPNPTRLRGFGQNGDFRHLGGIIAAKRDEPVQITFRNNLTGHLPLPIDRTIMGAEPENAGRTDPLCPRD